MCGGGGRKEGDDVFLQSNVIQGSYFGNFSYMLCVLVPVQQGIPSPLQPTCTIVHLVFSTKGLGKVFLLKNELLAKILPWASNAQRP